MGHTFFDRVFPNGFAGADVLAELAPERLNSAGDVQSDTCQ
jgi:hypothetical protein